MYVHCWLVAWLFDHVQLSEFGYYGIIFTNVCVVIGSRGSSVSIVSGYELDDQAMEVRSPSNVRDFSFSLCAQTGSGAQPASCTMSTRGPFLRDKARPGRDADHSPQSSVDVVNE
jgi:hypothetical protein